MNEIYGLTKPQFRTIGQMAREFKAPEMSVGTVEPADRSLTTIARLMTVGTDFPIYNPLETRKAALFQLARTNLQFTVKFFGENLWGRVVLTINGVSTLIDCRATTVELRVALSFLRDCRITAFPGLWEFAFSEQVTTLPVITCEPEITSGAQRFLGGIVITREGWRSVSADGISASLVDVIDCIPYIEGEVKLGAMALGHRYGAALYLCGQWSCPAFTFRSL